MMKISNFRKQLVGNTKKNVHSKKFGFIDGLPIGTFMKPNAYSSIKSKTLLKRIKLKASYISRLSCSKTKNQKLRKNLSLEEIKEDKDNNNILQSNNKLQSVCNRNVSSNTRGEVSVSKNVSNNSINEESKNRSRSNNEDSIRYTEENMASNNFSFKKDKVLISRTESAGLPCLSSLNNNCNSECEIKNNCGDDSEFSCSYECSEEYLEDDTEQNTDAASIRQNIQNIIKNNFERFKVTENTRKPEFYIYSVVNKEFERFSDPEDADVLDSDCSILVDHKGKQFFVFINDEDENGNKITMTADDIVKEFEFGVYKCQNYTTVLISKDNQGDINNDNFWDIFDCC